MRDHGVTSPGRYWKQERHRTESRETFVPAHCLILTGLCTSGRVISILESVKLESSGSRGQPEVSPSRSVLPQRACRVASPREIIV